jgi:hypothetical protein
MMRKGVSKTRRVAAAVAVSMVALLAMGTGANAAAPVLSVKNYMARSNASVLDVSLALPSALTPVLNAAKIANPIQQSIAFSRALGQVDKLGNTGHGLGQMFDGTLNETLETVTKALLNKTLPKAFAPLASIEKVVHEDLAAVNVEGLVKVGVSNVNASSTLAKLADGTQAIKSISDSELLGLTVGLTPALVDTLKGVLAPVLELTDGDSGLINTLNGLLSPVEDLVETALGAPVSLDLPQIAELLNQPLIHIGKITTRTVTDYATGIRNATGHSLMENIELFGTGENALVSIKALETDTFAQVGTKASDAKATAIHKIVGLKVLDNQISLIKGDELAVVVNGKTVSLGALGVADDLIEQLNGLLFDTLGLKINVLGTEHSATASKAFAKARTLEVEIAPNIAGNVLFDLKIAGPGSEVLAQGTSSLPVSFNPDVPAKTGVSTNLYLIAGPALIGMAVLVRRFALSK